MADNKIELRSEKVRHIIGEIPSRIVRYGITVITIVILGLLTGAYFIPYPETISGRVELTDTRHATMTIPYTYINKVTAGLPVTIEFEGYDAETYGSAHATIVSISRTPQSTAAGNVFAAQIAVTSCPYHLLPGMLGTASILVSNESVLQRIFGRVVG